MLRLTPGVAAPALQQAGEFFMVAALVMATCNVVGALIGTSLAVVKGSGFVRRFFLVLLFVLILKMGWGTLEMLI